MKPDRSSARCAAIVSCLFVASLCVASEARGAAALPTRGLWIQIEERGWASGYWPGQLMQQLTQFDPVVGSTVADEVALQLDAMAGLGVNTITIELRTVDDTGEFIFPTCHLNPVLGFHWPQPTATELANFEAFLDIVADKAMRVILVLVNTHMEELPRTNSATWLGAILGVVKDHPAFDFAVFNGDAHNNDTDGDAVLDACGGQAEAPLWLGPGAVPALYVKWALGYAMSLGIPSQRLSPGIWVGDFFVESEPPAGPTATDGHLWSPIAVQKSIYDQLGIAHAQRLYAISLYEHRKCSTAAYLPCTEAAPSLWAEQTLRHLYETIGWANGARVVAYEMGNIVPVEPTWTTSQALDSLLRLLAVYGADGGSFWRWTSFDNNEDSNVILAEPIKRRGTSFTYTPVKDVLVCHYTGACPAPPRILFWDGFESNGKGRWSSSTP